MSGKADWDAYWSGAGARGGCLPRAMAHVEAVLRGVWQQAAAALPRGARVLDLATGNGAVLAVIGAARPDLGLVGIDSAKSLPPGPAGATLRGGVAMERLPFEGGRFALATSQFGVEYGDVPAIVDETVRVLEKDGRIAFVVHNRDGPVVAHNAARLAALNWASAEDGLIKRARALVRGRLVADLPTPASFRGAVGEAQERFPDQGVAAEFAAAVLQTLEMGRRAPPRESLEVLATLEAKARGEAGRIEALCRAAMGGAEVDNLRGLLTAAGCAAAAAQPLGKDSGGAFAWLVTAGRG